MPRLPTPRTAALLIGAIRTAIGLAFLAAPVTAVRTLGVDTATAGRLDWLARMTAARDAVLGAGTLAAAARDEGVAPWLVAGAAADAADAVVLGTAIARRRAGGPGALGSAVLAGLATAAGAWAAVGLRGRS